MRRKSRLLTSLLQVLQRCYKVASSHTREIQSSGRSSERFHFRNLDYLFGRRNCWPRAAREDHN